jgi:methionyl-tRNA formyltransferase
LYVILRAIREYNIDIIFSIHYPWVLSSEVLGAVNHRAFNVHNAKIPDYKGFNMLSHVILNQDKTATTTIHYMYGDVDMGDIIFEETVDVSLDETAISLYYKINNAVKVNFLRFLDYLISGKELPRKPVVGYGRFYPKNVIDELKEIKDPSDTNEMSLKSRAFYCPPFEPAYYIDNGVKIYVTPERI